MYLSRYFIIVYRDMHKLRCI